MSNSYERCEPTDEIKGIIRAMADNRLKAGYTDAHQILDLIHSEIHEHTPLLKSQIADIVQSSSAGRKFTKSELSARRDQLRKDMRDIHPEAGSEARNASRQKAIQKQIDEIGRKMKEGDYQPAKKTAPIYDEPTLKLQKQLTKARSDWGRAVERFQYKNENVVVRTAKFVVAARRFGMLTGLPILWKLSGAALARVGTYPIEEAIGSLVKHLPGVPDIAAIAPREGHGWNTEAEIAALKATMSPKTLQEAWQKLMGQSQRKNSVSTEHASIWPVLEVSGRAHAAIKTPLEMSEAGRSLVHRTAFMKKKLAAEGKSPIEIDEAMGSPSNQAILYGQTVSDGLRAVFQGKNAASNSINSLIYSLQNPSKKYAWMTQQGMKGVGLAADYEMPIRGVPVNIAETLLSYGLGWGRAIPSVIKARYDLNLARKTNPSAQMSDVLSEEHADYIMRNLKQQPVGMALIGLGVMLGAKVVGGTYDDNNHKKPKDVPYNAINISGKPITKDLRGLSDRQLINQGIIPGNLMHHILGMLINMGAAMGEVYKQEHGGAAGAGAAGIKLLKEIWGELPFIDPIKKIVEGKTNLGDEVASNVPGIVNNIAQWTDNNADGATIKRYPQTLTDKIKERIPGLREQVSAKKPPKPPKAKKSN